MKTPAFCICENKDADQQLISAFVFAAYIWHSLFLLNPKALDIFCGCTAWFVSDLVGIPEDKFSCDFALKMFHIRVSINFQAT